MKNKLLIAVLFMGQFAFAQSTTVTNAWAKLSYKTDLSDAVSMTVGGQYRAKFGTDDDQWLTEVEFSKKIKKDWEIGMELRHYAIIDNQGGTQGIFQRGRVQLNTQYHMDMPKGEVHLRYALQQRFVLTGGGNSKFTSRFRAQYDYPIKNFKWDPTFEVEYLDAGAPNFDSDLRLGVGSSNKIGGLKFGVGYFYQRNFSNTDTHAHVIQTSIRF